MEKRIAIIDLGTNTFHLLIVSVNKDGSIEKEYSQKVPVKIGEGGISTGLIIDKAIERAIKTLSHFKETIAKYEVTTVKATATSAFRNAKNGQQVADLILEQTGISIDIIDGDREASLIHKGVKRALKIGTIPSVIMDIGGGSVEFIICDEDKVFWQRSFEIGGQRLMDKYHLTDPIPKSSKLALEAFLDEELTTLKNAALEFKPTTLIGSSGTFDTLCEIHHKSEKLEFVLDKQTEYQLPIDTFFSLNEQIVKKNRAQRLEIPGMILMRADMIVVACCLIEWVLKNINIDKIRVSTYALKEGLLETVRG